MSLIKMVTGQSDIRRVFVDLDYDDVGQELRITKHNGKDCKVFPVVNEDYKVVGELYRIQDDEPFVLYAEDSETWSNIMQPPNVSAKVSVQSVINVITGQRMLTWKRLLCMEVTLSGRRAILKALDEIEARVRALAG